MKNHTKSDFFFHFAIFALIIPQQICISRRNSNGGPMKGIIHLISLRILKPINAIQQKIDTGLVNIKSLALCKSDMSYTLRSQIDKYHLDSLSILPLFLAQ